VRTVEESEVQGGRLESITTQVAVCGSLALTGVDTAILGNLLRNCMNDSGGLRRKPQR
jgi:hypothetical protein